MFMFLQFEGTK